MNSFEKKIKQIKEALKEPLPGLNAQLEMFPSDRISKPMIHDLSEEIKKAAVLIHLFPSGGKIFFILTKRNRSLKSHPGQISFPGGRKDERDEDLQKTALRETREEVGLDTESIEVIGKLTKVFIPNTRFDVYPFISFGEKKPLLTRAKDEVAEIVFVSLNDLLKNDSVKEKQIIKNDKRIRIPYFELKGNVVWGATAIILSELKAILKR